MDAHHGSDAEPEVDFAPVGDDTGMEPEPQDKHMMELPETQLDFRERCMKWFLTPPDLCRSCCTCKSMYSVAEPKDRFNLVYVCMLMAGAGFLLPWSSYISAIDYFFFLYRSEFPNVSEAIPVTFLLTTFFFTTVNIGLVNIFSIHTRIRFGYVIFALALVFIPLLDIGINNCTVSTHSSYYLTFISIVAIGVGSGVQQSSYYGLSSMLPRRYSQAVMAGESIAGVLVSATRIITKLSIESERISSIVFFVISLLFVLVCFCCHIYIQCSPFVQYHTVRCQKKKKKKKKKKEQEQSSHDENDKGEEMKMKEIRSSNTDVNGTNKESSRKPSDPPEEYEFSGQSDDDQVELIPSSEDDSISDYGGGAESKKSWAQSFVKGLWTRWIVVTQIWKLMIAIFANYFVTLLVFPGLVSEVQFCQIGDWMPVILIAVFNLFDFVAKWLALLPWSLRRSSFQLMIASLSRSFMIPLILLCIVPSPSSPVIGGGAAVGVAVLFNFLLGITNGFFGSLPMINVSKEVDRDLDREIAGTIMTWVLLFALTLGSVLAYALTPLTTLAPHTDCYNNTETFFCNQGNTSMTSL